MGRFVSKSEVSEQSKAEIGDELIKHAYLSEKEIIFQAVVITVVIAISFLTVITCSIVKCLQN